MELNLGELIGRMLPPPTPFVAPKWLRGDTVCPVRRGDEIWWQHDGSLLVRGFKPEGTLYRHEEAHILPANFGPEGEPRQVTAHVATVHGMLAMRDNLDQTLAHIELRHYKLVTALANRRGERIRWCYYATEEEQGPPKMLAVFAGTTTPNERGGVDLHFEPFAFVAPTTIDLRYFMDEAMMAQLPLFGGGAHLGFAE